MQMKEEVVGQPHGLSFWRLGRAQGNCGVGREMQWAEFREISADFGAG